MDNRTSNEYVGRAMLLLRDGLSPFVTREIARCGPHLDLSRISRFLEKPPSDMDVSDLLALMEAAWSEVFRRSLSRSDRSLVVELREFRNRWAHQEAMGWRDADRALDSCERLLQAVGAAEQVERVAADRLAMARQFQDLTDELFLAVRRDNIPRLVELIEIGANVNAQGHAGYTPLMWARSVAATRMLVDAGARVDARDGQGHTALMWVISKSSVPADAGEIAAVLLSAGADRGVRDHEGSTALDWARAHRRRLRDLRNQRIAESLVAVLAGSGG